MGREVARAAGRENPPGGKAPNLEDLEGDPRVQQLRTDVEAWLRDYSSPRTRESYAERLGAPRSWIPGRTVPDPQRRRGRRPRGYSGTEWLLWCWLHAVPYLEPTRDDVNSWLDVLAERGYSQRTQAAWVSSASSFYRHLVREGRTRSNPMEMVNRKTRRLRSSDQTRTGKALTFEQLRSLLEGAWLLAPHTRNGYRDRAIVEALAGTGMRADELVELDLTSYHRVSPGSAGTMLVRRKGGKTQMVGVPVEVADAVDDYLTKRRPGTLARTGEHGGTPRQPLFVTATGQRLHPKHVTYVLRQVVEAFTPDTPPRQRWRRDLLASQAGTRISSVLREIKGASGPHRLRYSYGTHAIQSGIPMRQVQLDLGHADVSTTEAYVHDEHQAEQAAGHQLSPALHRGWAKPRTTTERLRELDRDQVPGQTSVPLPVDNDERPEDEGEHDG